MAGNGSRSFRIISMNEMKKVPNKLEEKNEKAHVPSQPAFIIIFLRITFPFYFMVT